MKKGLLSILASALLVVGCQNYDDQFSNLESQISALATTVAGLSQVQSDLSSLAGTVASLASTVNGLGSTIDTAVASGLADIQADVDAITTAVADVASTEDVAALQTAVDASQTDLDELLANSSVFTGKVTINSIATLAAFKAMGSTLAIINGSVNITVKTDMSQTDIQAVVDQMLTITGDFTYTSQAATIAETKFTNLSGVQSITVTQAGGYSFPALVSATDITLGTTFSSKVGVIDFGELTSVVKFASTADHQVHFSKATNFHITKLPRYGAALSVLLDEGSTFLMDALEDKNAAGTQSLLSLTIEGPKAMNISKLDGKGGTLSMKDVVTATVTDYDGTIILLAGVETFSSNNVVAITHSGADDIVSFTAKGVLDPNSTTDKNGPVIDLSSKSDLETVVLTGDFTSIKLNGNNNMTSATIGAKSSNGIIDITDNGDLTTLDTTGSSATGFTLTNNDNLVSAALQTTMIAGTATAAKLNGSVIVTNNDDMTTLEIWSSSLNTLTITGNSDLNKITGTKIIAKGVTAGGTVTIHTNDLEATIAQVLTPKTASAVSTGAFTTASNMGSLSAFLAKMATDTKATALVYFDTVQSTTDSATLESIATTTGSVTANSILVTTPGTADVTTGNNSLVKAQRAWSIPTAATIQFNLKASTELDGVAVDLLHNGTAYGPVTTTGNIAIDLALLKSSLATSRATALGMALDVKATASPIMPSVTFRADVASSTGGNGESYTNTAVANLETNGVLASLAAVKNHTMITSYDVFTLTVNGKSVTASITLASGVTSATGETAASYLAAALAAKWAVYATGGASALYSLWTTASATAAINIALKSTQSGSRGVGDIVSVSWAKATSAQVSLATAGLATTTVMDWNIGATEATTDNVAVGSALLLTLTEVTNPVTAGDRASMILIGANSVNELATTNKLYSPVGVGTATSTALTIYPLDARGDVVIREGANEGTTASGTARFITNRSGWTFGG